MLYYPHYTPSQVRLRSILLFSDRVWLIVPYGDQPGVERRRHIEELLSHDSTLIEMKDPTYAYSGWMRKEGVAQAAERLIARLVDETEEQGDLAPIQHDRRGRVGPGQDDEIADRWSRKGWKYVAEEKFPQEFQDFFFSDGMALRVGHFTHPKTGEIIEHNGVLCHPALADFVLARMAREASLIEGLPSITFGGLDYANHLFDVNRPQVNVQHQLLQSTMDLLVPDKLGNCDVREFTFIRQEYESLRRLIRRYLEDIAKDTNLDLAEHDQTIFLERLEYAREQIREELSAMKRQVGRDRFREGALFAFEAATTVGLAAAGAHFGGPLMAAATAGIGFAMATGAKSMSTLGENRDGTAKSIAMSIAKIEKRNVPKRRYVPHHWI